MAAACAAAESGCRVTMVDENAAPGGQIFRGYADTETADQPHARTFSSLYGRVRAANIDVLAATRVVDAPAPQVLRVEDESGARDLQYDRLILVTGARERFLPFPGWTLPGIVGAGGLQVLVKSGLPVAGKRVVLAGSGPLLLAVAANLAKNGAVIAGVFEQAPVARLARFAASLVTHPAKLLEGAQYRFAVRSASYCTNAWVKQASGTNWVESVTVRTSKGSHTIACDYLACGFHLVPNLELPRLLGCDLCDGYVRVDSSQQTSIPHVYCAGELTGIGGLDKANVEGRIAGLSATGIPARHLHARRNRAMRFARQLDAAFALRPELRELAAADTIVCRCEDVCRSALEGLHSGREAKLHARCGMGPCQGRICGPATRFLFGWESEGMRPPVTPARIETLTAPLLLPETTETAP